MATGAVAASDKEEDHEEQNDGKGDSTEHLHPEWRTRMRFAVSRLVTGLFAHIPELTRQRVSIEITMS
jgi:hypothetical protein